jgi:hypothetical protein
MKSEGQKASQAHEKRLEKVLNGARTAASGAFWSRKGDVRSERFLAEHKYTAAKSFSIKASELKKIETEALMVGRVPIFCISLDNRDYVLLLEDDFIEMAELGDTP